MFHSNNIKTMDTMVERVVSLSKGNPGALNCLLSLIDNSKSEGLPYDFSLRVFENLGISGTDIYVLWSDICDRDSKDTLSVLRATELGVLSPDVVRDAASRQDFSGRTLIDVRKVVEEVKAICKV